MIKPEDVPKSLVYDVYAQMKRCLELDELGTPVSTEQQVADLLILCVEAGIVSPPAYCLRWDGELQIQEQTSSPKLFPGKPWASDCEHWKGQTT